MLGVLAQIDGRLCEEVAAGLGLPAPVGDPATDVEPSAALSQIPFAPGSITGRVIGVVAGPGADLAGIGKLRKAVQDEGAVLRVIAPVGGVLTKGRAKEIIERALPSTRSVEYDAVLVAGGIGDLKGVKLTVLLQEVFRHCKVIGTWGDGRQVLKGAGIDPSAPGVLHNDTLTKQYTSEVLEAVGLHRVWERAELVMAE
jgi:catalase